MNWAGRRVLVTGAGGFIGSHLIERLISMGAHTKAFVRYNSSGSWDWLDQSPCNKDVEVVAGDVRDYDTVRQAMKQVDIVFHLAANPDIRYGIKHPDTDLKQGTLTTFNVLEAMRQGNISKVVFSSSSVIYGEPTVIPTPEEYAPLIPVSLYGKNTLPTTGTSLCHITTR